VYLGEEILALPWNSVPITKHLAERLFLVRADKRRWLQIHIQVGVKVVVAEVVLFQDGVVELDATFFHPLYRRDQ